MRLNHQRNCNKENTVKLDRLEELNINLTHGWEVSHEEATSVDDSTEDSRGERIGSLHELGVREVIAIRFRLARITRLAGRTILGFLFEQTPAASDYSLVSDGNKEERSLDS